jgi:hypothetical protein
MREIDYNVHLLVARHKGALPVILTAPHDRNPKRAGHTKRRVWR